MASEVGIRLSLAGASQVQGGLSAVGNGLGELDSRALKVGDAFKKFGGLLAGALSVGAIGSFLKGAIDAADETFNLSQKVGIAAKDLGGLQLAFKQAGIDSGGMQTALVKLSKNVVDGNAAFRAMGVSLKSTDGSLKSSKQVLGEVADVFRKMPDGIDKTALATEVFGKAGADLIPMLNGGSAGLEEMAAMAERLGLVIDDQTAASADQFNDTVELLGLSLQGVGRQVAAEMLPTLTRLAGSLLNSATEGDTLKKAADILSTALRGLYSVAVGIVEIFNTVGKAIGGTIAAVMAALQGDFAGAKQILAESAVDIKAGWSSAGAAIANAWEESGDSSITAAAAIVGSGDRSIKSAKDLAAEQDKAAKASAAYAAEGLKLADSLVAQDNGLSGDFFDKWGKLQAALAAGKIGSDQFYLAQAELLKQQPYMKAALKDQEAATKDLEESKKSYLQAFQMLRESELAEVEDLQKLIARQREQNETMGLSSEQLAALEQARLRDALAIAEQTLQLRINEGLSGAELEAYTLKVESLRELIRLREEGNAKAAVLAEATAARDAWKQTVDSIQNGLTDALFRAFESGRGFLDAFKDVLVNTFKTTVLQPVIKAIIAPVTGAVGSMLGIGNAAASAGSAAGSLGSLSGFISSASNFLSGAASFLNGSAITNSAMVNAIDVGNWLSTSGNQALAGLGNGISSNAGSIGGALGAAGNGFAGYGISKALSGGYSAGGWVNTAAAIASMIPGIGPIAGVVGGLVNRAFGRGPKKIKETGIDGSIQAGDVEGRVYQNWKKKGGWFRSDKTGTDTLPIETELANALDLGAANIIGQTREWARVLKLPADALGKITTNFKVKLTGDTAKDQAAIEGLFDTYQTALAAPLEKFVKPWAKAGETITDTLARLSIIQTFSETLGQFGGIFGKIAGSSFDARDSLIELAGGIDALMSKAQSFVQNYYSVDEQAAINAASLKAALGSLGLGNVNLANRADYRALVESRDVNSQSGREQLAGLLDLASTFAGISDYLEQTGQSLSTVAGRSPGSDLMSQIAASEQSRTATIAANDAAAAAAQAARDAALQETLAGLREDTRAGYAALASWNMQNFKLLSSWDDGGRMLVSLA